MRSHPCPALFPKQLYPVISAFSQTSPPCLPVTIQFTLRTDVISQHGSQDEILFRRQQIQRTIHHHTDSIDTFRFAEKQIDPFLINRLNDKTNTLTLQAAYSKCFILPVSCIKNHLPHTFLEFINMVQENLQLYRIYIRSNHTRSAFSISAHEAMRASV